MHAAAEGCWQRQGDPHKELSGHTITVGLCMEDIARFAKAWGTKVEIVGFCMVLPSLGETWEAMAGMLEAIPGAWGRVPSGFLEVFQGCSKFECFLM